jgi:hypothetical protein
VGIGFLSNLQNDAISTESILSVLFETERSFSDYIAYDNTCCAYRYRNTDIVSSSCSSIVWRLFLVIMSRIVASEMCILLTSRAHTNMSADRRAARRVVKTWASARIRLRLGGRNFMCSASHALSDVQHGTALSILKISHHPRQKQQWTQKGDRVAVRFPLRVFGRTCIWR